jgi:lipopolysaccharide/colanic/teichoic acid biosynthesis glycosyltransferase
MMVIAEEQTQVKQKQVKQKAAVKPEKTKSRKWTFTNIIKRLFELVISTLSLILLSPFFGLIAIAIKRESPGPALYKAKRIGRDGKLFDMYKFRTMYERPESYNGPKLTPTHDPRVTPLGYWLRKTKINELPQLWNILKGDMSLVGPRPEDPAFVEKWDENEQHEILSVAPGITSPASILYRDEEQLLSANSFIDDYINSLMPDKIRLDLLYVRNHNFLSDLDIIIMTILVLLPQIRNAPIGEKALYSGPIFRFFSRYLSWFIIDFIVAFISVGFAGVVWRIDEPIHLGFPNALLLAFLVAILLSLVSTVFGLQRIVWRYANPSYIVDIGMTVLSTIGFFSLVNVLWLETRIPLLFIVVFGMLTFLGLVTVRYGKRLLSGLASRWMLLNGGNMGIGEGVLVVGADSGGEMAVWMLNKCEYSSLFNVKGFVDDDYRKHGVKMIGYPILGSTHDIPKIVEELDIGLILFSITDCRKNEKERILNICHQTGARTVIIPDLMNVFVTP